MGDAVGIAWELEPLRSVSPGWVPARVARILPRPFGAHHVCFSFEIIDPKQAALMHDWHQASLEDNRRRRRHERAA